MITAILANVKGKKMKEKKGKTGNWFMRLSRGRQIALCTGWIFVCLVASAVLYVSAKLGKVEREVIPKEKIIINDLEEDVGVGYTNFAVFGVDSRDGEVAKGTRTDCLMIASLNNETKEVKLVSVYRDSLLNLSDGTLQKCNSAYSYGGAEQAINMLNMNLDLDIQDFVTVDFAAVSDVIDMFGGIEIEIQEEEVPYINEFIDETGIVAGKAANHIMKPGVQNLDGVQATTYARIRSTAGSDFTRTERQRRVIEKIVEKVVNSDLMTINSMIDQIFPKIKTSLGITEIFKYAKSFAKYRISETTGFPMEKTTGTIQGKGSVVIPMDLVTNVKMLHEFLYGKVEYQPSSEVQSIDREIKAVVETKQLDSSEEQLEEADNTAQENKNYDSGDTEVNYGSMTEPEMPQPPEVQQAPESLEEPAVPPAEQEEQAEDPAVPPTSPVVPPTEPDTPPAEQADPNLNSTLMESIDAIEERAVQ